jgi:hypothetical protein
VVYENTAFVKILCIKNIKKVLAYHFMVERKFCAICNKDVEIVKVISSSYEEQIMSCDHIAGRINASPISINPLDKS